MRPRGDPERLAAGSRLLAGAAEELGRTGGELASEDQGVAGPDAWRGAAAEAYRARSVALEDGIAGAAVALRAAAAGLAELSAAVAGAQSLWDRASSLAASSGLPLDPNAPGPPPIVAFPALDPRTAIAARVAELAAEATDRAALADQIAARRLGEVATLAGRAGTVAGGGAATLAGGGAAGAARDAGPGGTGGRPGALGTDDRGGGARAGHGPGGAGAEARSRRHGEGESLLARGVEVLDRIGVAVGAGLAALEARAGALTRLVQSGEEPAAGLAAVRALAAFERSAFTDTLAAFLPLGGPAITVAANLLGGEQGEPMLRALVRSLGASIGADAGQRVGMAICGIESGATEGAGAFVCPAIAIASTSAGASLGGAAAVRIYDALDPAPDPPMAAAAPAARLDLAGARGPR
jgi:uncharacterized protein YukE